VAIAAGDSGHYNRDVDAAPRFLKQLATSRRVYK